MILNKIVKRLYSIYFNANLLLKYKWNYYFGYCVVKNKFPYDLLRPMPKGGEEVMKRGCQFLKEAGIKYFLSSGTALGVYQYDKFFEHDPDIDVDIIGPIDRKAIDEIFIKKMKMKLGLEITYKHNPQQMVFYTNREITFDLHVWYIKDNWAYNYSQNELIWKHPSHFYKKFDKVKFRGVDYPIPNNVEKYLEHLYGKEWNILKTKKTDFIESRFDIEKK